MKQATEIYCDPDGGMGWAYVYVEPVHVCQTCYQGACEEAIVGHMRVEGLTKDVA